MVARLIKWPKGLNVAGFTWLKGPVSAGSKSNVTISGATQYVSAPTSPLAFSLMIVMEYGTSARRADGMLTALHNGANALQFPWNLAGQMADLSDFGLPSSQNLNWSNGFPWSNGLPWRGGPPVESVAAAVAKDTSIVTLGSSSWGAQLGMGDQFGFNGLFGVYKVTETYPDNANKYRVWPPLRADITTSTVATLEPYIVVKAVGEIPINIKPYSYDPVGLTLVEVPDATVRAYYTLT